MNAEITLEDVVDGILENYSYSTLSESDVTVRRLLEIKKGISRGTAERILNRATKDGMLVKFEAYDPQSRRKVWAYKPKTGKLSIKKLPK